MNNMFDLTANNGVKGTLCLNLGLKQMPDEPNKPTLLVFATQIVAAHVSHNKVASDTLPSLIRSVFGALSGASGAADAQSNKSEPAVPIKKSVLRDHIVCLDCGKHFSMLKRHLNTDHHMTPDAYRAKWGLPRDYPMVSSDHSERRSTLAKKFGLGRKAAAPIPEPMVAKAPAGQRGRPRKS